MTSRLFRYLLGSAFAAALTSVAAASPAWPDAPPATLREELFGIRFRLVLHDKGPKAAEKFLRETLAASGTAPEVVAYVSWVSLWPDAWGMQPILSADVCEPLLRAAVRAGSPLAADVLGRACLAGQGGISRDPQEGLQLLDLAVERGLPRAIARRGVLWATGWVGPRDMLKGAQEIRRAAALGSANGLMEMAELWESGGPFGPPNPAVALEHYYLLALENEVLGWRKLAEHAQAQTPGAAFLHSLAKLRFANEGGFIVPSAVREHIAALERSGLGDGRALVELGVARLFGVDWVKRDPVLAKSYFERAAALGNEEARFFLAYFRLRGLAGPQETDAALQEMTAMADAGSVRAAARLGYFYYWGTSDAGKLKKDPAKAFHYARLAAERGSKWSAANLAHCYKHGIGTKENPVLAARLYWIAMEYNIRGAKEELLRQLPFAKVP